MGVSFAAEQTQNSTPKKHHTYSQARKWQRNVVLMLQLLSGHPLSLFSERSTQTTDVLQAFLYYASWGTLWILCCCFHSLTDNFHLFRAKWTRSRRSPITLNDRGDLTDAGIQEEPSLGEQLMCFYTVWPQPFKSTWFSFSGFLLWLTIIAKYVFLILLIYILKSKQQHNQTQKYKWKWCLLKLQHIFSQVHFVFFMIYEYAFLQICVISSAQMPFQCI